jgi:hypothetical protein
MTLAADDAEYADHSRYLRSRRRKLPFDRRAKRWHAPQRVLVIDLSEHFVGEANSGDVPAAVAGRSAGRPELRRVLEVLVVRLEKTPVRRPEIVHAALRVAVGPHENPILILQEERAPETRCTSEILHGRGDFDVRVGIGIEKPCELFRIVVEHGEVRVHEVRARMLAVHVLARALDDFVRRKPVVVVVVRRVAGHVPQARLVAFVLRSDRIEAAD